MSIEPGTIITVKDWPGTKRRRFRVSAVLDDVVHAVDQERSQQRSFPARLCAIVSDPSTGVLSDVPGGKE